MDGYALDIGEPARWVAVHVERKLVVVACERCRGTTAFYWTVIGKQRGAVRGEVEAHNSCSEGA